MSFLNLLLWSTDFLNVGLRNGNEVETENGGAGQDLMNYQVLLRFHLFRKSKN